MTVKKNRKYYFDPVDAKPDFPAMEKKILKYWERNGIVDKYLKRNKSSERYFSFLDGPITANNPMGVHHAWGRTYKDLWQRYKNMQGYKQRFQNGFDCQGLWVEVEVEKELGLKSKKDIENLVKGNKKKSIAKFVDLCKKRVYKYADIQTEQSKRLGYFMDWENSYYTLSDDNNYMIWYFLKKCHEKGLIYKGRDSVPWCPRCGTAISQHEMLTEDYKEMVHDSIYFELPIVDKKNEFLLVWTTTPWTLPANVAVVIDKKLEYSLIKGNSGDLFWIAKDAVSRVFGKDYKKIIKTVKGNYLVGMKYRSAFDHLDRVKKASKTSKKFHSVVATNDRILAVSADEGTGMVHVATGAGTEDYALGKVLSLPIIEVIDEGANYLEGLGEFSGENAKDHPKIILDYLKERDDRNDENWVFDIEKYKHRYPACWRCKTELVWRVVDEWYISMDKKYKNTTYRKSMQKVAKKISWIPEFGLKRELDWLNNMHDWLISKSRYWGLALPIWECESCGEFDVIGSKEELKKRAVKGWEKFDGRTPHKPFIDEVQLKCLKCGGVTSRIPDVGSPWLDAGIVAYSTVTKDNKKDPLYFKNKKEWKRWIPADFITESFPGQFKNWFYSLVAMSTMLEDVEPTKTVMGFATLFAEDGTPMHKSSNMIEFNEGADKIGVDVMRWMYVRQEYSQNLLFGYKVANEIRRKFHLKLWNVINFFVTYANLNSWIPSKDSVTKEPKTDNLLDKWLLSRFSELLIKVTKGLNDYDATYASGEIEDFVEDLSNWYIRRSRERAGISYADKKDSKSFFNTTYYVLVNFAKILAPFTPFIADRIYTDLTKNKSVHLTDWPESSRKIDNRLIKDMAFVRDVVEKAHAIRKDKRIPVRQPLASLATVAQHVPVNDLSVYVKDEVNVKEWVVVKGKTAKNTLDTKITPELKEEAKARGLIRKIQNERKKMGIRLDQKIVVKSEWIPKSNKITQQVMGRTLAKKLDVGEFSVRLA